MKTREGYVSNSSSSSFLVPCKPDVMRVNCIKLPKEIWKAIEKNHVEYDGTKFDMSMSEEWWLTELVSDCCSQYEELADIPNAIHYLEGNEMPYGAYDEDGEKDYIKFKSQGQEFWMLASDFMDAKGDSEIPEVAVLRDNVHKVLQSKNLTMSQKLSAISHLFDF